MRTLALSNLTKGIILVVVVLLIGGGLVVWKNKVGGHSATSFNSITRPEVEMLLADVAKSNPAVLKRLNEDPELKKQQLDSLKQLLAFASQAKADGMADEPNNKQELENIRAEITAVNYDREMNSEKGPMPPFGFITEDMVNEYWGQDSLPAAAQGGFSSLLEKIGLATPTETRTHEAEFQAFLDTKVALLKSGNPEMADREISEEEKTQAREVFAKIRIYKNEYDTKKAAGQLSQELIDRVDLQVKLQQAQFLARLYSETLTDKLKVTDEEVDKYIAEHPELSPTEKRTKAQGILDRAKAGEDFAALANEFSEDPGNKSPDDGGKGGLYADVPKGRMVAPFETAALALQPGDVSPELVETDFGFHIIKLERALGKKDGADGETYDVRHILISTNIKDPDKPNAQEMPVKKYVQQKLETEKQKTFVDNIVAANNVSVPEDFTVPEVTDEQMQEMQQKQMQQMQQMQGGPGGPGAPGAPGAPPADGKPAPGNPEKAEPKKPEAKKK